MRKLAWHNSFRQAFKRMTKRDQKLKEQIFRVLNELMNDPFQPVLKTHKLSGQLYGLWACWVEYDCRIVFTFAVDSKTNEELIVLIDLGTHDEVY
jgi:mRNA interferase YafQ